MKALELFNHRYSEDEKFSWLEMIDFAEAYASQSKEECANYARSKAVTDGEIKQAASAYEKIACCEKDHPFLKEYVNEDFEAGAKWMREQHGEGAKERYERAKSHILRYYKCHEIPQAHWDGYKIASGYTDKQ